MRKRTLLVGLLIIIASLPIAFNLLIYIATVILEQAGVDYIFASVAVSLLPLMILFLNCRVKKLDKKSAPSGMFKITHYYLAALLLLIVPAVIFMNAGFPSIRQVTFKSDVWNSPEAVRVGFPRKVNMVADLKENYLRTGMSRAEVSELIDDCTQNTKATCTTYIGPQRDTVENVTSAWLDLMFEDGHLVDFEERVE